MSNQKEDTVFNAFHNKKTKKGAQKSQENMSTDSPSNEQNAKVVVTLPGDQAVNGELNQATETQPTEIETVQEATGQGAADNFINNKQGISPEAERFLNKKGSQSDNFLDFLEFKEVETGDPAPVLLDQAFFNMVKDISISEDNAVTINFFNRSQFIAVPENWLTNEITIAKLVDVGVRYSYVPNQNLFTRLKNVLVHNGGNISSYTDNKYFWLPSKQV